VEVSDNALPDVNAGADQTIDEGSSVDISATFSDADIDDTHTATIDWGDGSPPEDGTLSETDGSGTVAGSHTYVDNGSYTATVTVSDGRGVGQGSLTVTVNNVVPSAAVGGPYDGVEGSAISFNGSGSDPGADELTFEWDFDYDGATFDIDGTGASPQHTYAQDGSYTVGLRVIDDDGGASAVSTATATPADIDPVADFTFTPSSPSVDASVSFNDATTSYDGITSYEWDFDVASGLDVNSTAQNPSHAYAVAGTYTVRLTVRESDGDVAMFEKQVVISEQPTVAFYFSLRSSASVGGISVANEDIVAFDGADFSLYFDGSDVGLGGARIDGFVITSSTEILMSFSSSEDVPGIGGVDDSDIVKFTATSLGASTAGSFEVYFDGSDVGLTRSGEDIDAVELLPDGTLLLSTTGSFSVPGLSGRDEDLFTFTPASLGSSTAGTFALYFDGSDVGLSNSDEDIFAVTTDASGRIFLSTKGNFSVSGISGADEDVFVFIPSSLGSSTSGTFDPVLFFDGSAFGLSDNDIYGIDLP
jgi:PKD repeat protein